MIVLHALFLNVSNTSLSLGISANLKISMKGMRGKIHRRFVLKINTSFPLAGDVFQLGEHFLDAMHKARGRERPFLSLPEKGITSLEEGVAHAFNLSTGRQRQGKLSKFEPSPYGKFQGSQGYTVRA